MAYLYINETQESNFFLIAVLLIGRKRLTAGLIFTLQSHMGLRVYWLNGNNETDLEYALRGKAWKVYWFLLKTGSPVGVREVQRSLHFSSPSIAFHHLEQLRELGLVEKQEVGGHYVLGGSSKNWCASTLRKLRQIAVSTLLLLCPVLNSILCGLPAYYCSQFYP